VESKETTHNREKRMYMTQPLNVYPEDSGSVLVPERDPLTLPHHSSTFPVNQSQKPDTPSFLSSLSSVDPSSGSPVGCVCSGSTPRLFDGLIVKPLVLVITGFTRMDLEGSDWDAKAVGGRADVETDVVVGGGSVGFSTGSLCSPMGLKGRRKVPLLGAGMIPTESQRTL